MFDVLWFPVGVQLLFPIVLLVWLAFRQHPSRAAWGLAVAFVAAIQPRHPAAYTIFGDSVVAQCAGRDVTVADGLPDQLVPDVDRTHMAGHHVLPACGRVHVLLGHLQRASVAVHAADTVASGALLGRVGNTGNTGEPHQHIDAQRAGTLAMPLGGDPLPIQLSGWYPVRNQRRTERR